MRPHHSISSISLSLFATVILFQAWIQTSYADKLDVAIARGIMREPSAVCADYDSTTHGATSFTDVFTSSNAISQWDSYNAKYEDDVFQTELSHTDSTNENRTWALRIGKGGQVVSFIGAYGEAMANQGRQLSVWNDLVQQTVATTPSGGGGFIHQSGPYMLKQATGMPPPFYSPKVAFECSDNQCTTVNWGQSSLGVIESQAEFNAKSQLRSDVMFYTRYSNCGNGIIEVDQFIHNFGSSTKTFFNTPWTGVRTSTLKSMMVANTNYVLKNQWPLRDWGHAPEYIKNVRDTGGFTTFAQSISTGTSKLRHPAICKRYNNNAFIDCTARTSIRYMYSFKVQPNGCQAETRRNDRTTPPGASRRAIRISNLGSTNSGHRNKGSHPPDGLLMRNTNTGYEMHILSVSHFSYYNQGVEKTYIMVSNSISNSQINANFPAGHGVEFYYAPPTGKSVEDNLSLTFVHGRHPEQRWNTRMRAGMPGNKRRDGTIWTTNFMNSVTAGGTYFNRKFLITGQYKDVNTQAMPLVRKTIEDVDSIGDYANVGESISLYYGNEEFGATVGTEMCGEKLLSCTGSSAPKSGMKPLFYITCGDQRVVTHDPYFLNKYGSSLRPWACGGSTDLATRPDYKMLGYFPTNGDCGDVSDLSYSETFCEPGPPRDTSTTEVQIALTVNAPEEYDATEICNEIVNAMKTANPNYKNTGCTVSDASPGRRLAVLEVVTTGTVSCAKEGANACVEDFETSASNTGTYNSVTGITVADVSVAVIFNMDASINYVSNCTHIEFSDTTASEEIALCYNISDKNATVRLFDKTCTEELTSTAGLSLSSMERVDGTPATTNDDLTVKIDVNGTAMSDVTSDNNIWSYDADTKIGKIEFCVRIDLLVESTSINFHENQLTIDVDMSNDFQLVSISTMRVEADVEETEAETNITLNGFQCEDSTGTVSNAVMSQGKVLGLCVEMVAPATGVKLVSVSSLDFVQDGGASSSPIVDGTVVGIAEANCEYKNRTLCFIQAIITSEFYNQEYADLPMTVSGSVIFEFARRRRHRRQLEDSSIAFDNDVEQDVPAIQEPPRILQEDSSSSSPAGGFSLTINLRETTSVEDPASSASSKNDDNTKTWMMSGVGLGLVAIFASVSTATYFFLVKWDQREEVMKEEEGHEVDVSTKLSSMHLA